MPFALHRAPGDGPGIAGYMHGGPPAIKRRFRGGRRERPSGGDPERLDRVLQASASVSRLKGTVISS